MSSDPDPSIEELIRQLKETRIEETRIIGQLRETRLEETRIIEQIERTRFRERLARTTGNSLEDLPIITAAGLIESTEGPVIGFFHQYA